jgi:hypothetical protein
MCRLPVIGFPQFSVEGLEQEILQAPADLDRCSSVVPRPNRNFSHNSLDVHGCKLAAPQKKALRRRILPKTPFFGLTIRAATQHCFSTVVVIS